MDGAHARLGHTVLVGGVRHHLLGGGAVRGRERLVVDSENVRARVRCWVRADLVQLARDGEADGVEVEVVQVVAERVLDLLPDLEEAEQQEGRECSRPRGQVKIWPTITEG